jgi:hypothetical protein
MKTLNGRYMDQRFIEATFPISKIPYSKTTGTFNITTQTKFTLASMFGRQYSYQSYPTEFLITLKNKHGQPFDLHSTLIDD